MFERLRNVFSQITDKLKQRDLSKSELEEVMQDLRFELLECDVAEEVVKKIIEKLTQAFEDSKVYRNQDPKVIIKQRLYGLLEEILNSSGQIDIINTIKEKREKGLPYIVLFLGINGTGKTTTVAKFANMLRKEGFTVTIAASDTHRAGAIEQISEHASKIGVKVISQRYGSDPAAVARDGVMYVRSRKIDVLLIDTAGRMQTNRNLMEEMSKIVRVVNPDLKLLVVDSLTGNDALSQAKLFLQYTGFDGLILTKVDADSKGGSAISIAFETRKPIMFIGTGQSYDDIKRFNTHEYLEQLLK